MTTAVLDANIFFSVWVTDPLLSFADADLYDPIWSETIMDEVRRHLPEVWSNAGGGVVERYVHRLNDAFPTAGTHYLRSVENAIHLPDRDDRHVVAVAVAAHAQFIVTWNLRDFPSQELRKWNLEAVSPDDFLCLLFDLDQEEAFRVMRQVVTEKNHPPRSMTGEITELRRQRLRNFADKLEQYCRGAQA